MQDKTTKQLLVRLSSQNYVDLVTIKNSFRDKLGFRISKSNLINELTSFIFCDAALYGSFFKRIRDKKLRHAIKMVTKYGDNYLKKVMLPSKEPKE